MAKKKIDWKELEGYEKYKAYIKSPEWRSITRLVRDRDKTCRCCHRNEEQAILSVHHATYEHLYDEENHLDDLILLCKVCHKAIHSSKSNYQRFRQNKPKK